MTPKIIGMTLFLSTLALAQSSPNGTQTPSKPSTAATNPAQNGKGPKGAAAKGSGSHNMSGNHKDVMGVAANKPQASGSHSVNMIGNHKDVMEAAAPAPAAAGKSQPAPAPAAQPAPSPNRPKK
jgi:hypothetical protein